MENKKCYLGDCLEIMKNIPNKSIDMILCDLPYGITKNKWDNSINLELLWCQYRRIIKDNGAICLFGQGLFTASLICSNKEMYRYDLIWEKTKAGGFLNARRKPLQAHENISIFYKKLPIYNPQMEVGEPYIRKSVTNGDGKNYGEFDRVGKIAVNVGTRFPRSVIKISNDNHKSLHPTQKPVTLLEYLIKTYTNENELVLDNCAGSMSTAIACINTNRKYIMIEQDENYYNIGVNRIEKHLKERKSNEI